MPFKEGRLPCKRREKWRSTKLAKKSGKVKTENMKICFKMHARAEVMPNGASKVGHFPPTRQNTLFFAQHNAEMPSHKWWFWSQVGYGNVLLHTIIVKIVLRKCASHRGRGAHFHKKCKKMKKNMPTSITKIKLFEASYGDSKNELQIMIAKRPQIEKVIQTLTAKGDFDVTLGRLGATLDVLWGPFGVTGGWLGGSLGTFLVYFPIVLDR